MARLQILELPEGASDERPPFVLVVDQCVPQRVVLGMGDAPVRDYWREVADKLGARAVIVTAETVEIPANEVPAGPDGYPVRLRVEADLTGFREQVGAAIVEAQADARQAVAEGGHRFGVPGYLDPQRCAQCGLDRQAWHFGRDRRACAEVQQAKAAH